MKGKHYHIQHIELKTWQEPGCGILEDVMSHFEEDKREKANGVGGKYAFSYKPHPEDIPSLIYREIVIVCSNPECEKHPEFYDYLTTEAKS